MIEAVQAFDSEIHQWVISHRVAWLTEGFRVLTNLAGGLVTTVVIAALIVYALTKRRFLDGAFLLLAASSAQVVNTCLKLLFARARPDSADFLVQAGGFAFPSGHAMKAVVAYGLTALMLLRWRVVRSVPAATAAVALVSLGAGVSRVYLGVHWPTDVLGGWIVGAVWLALCWRVFRRVERRVGLGGRASEQRFSPVQ